MPSLSQSSTRTKGLPTVQPSTRRGSRPRENRRAYTTTYDQLEALDFKRALDAEVVDAVWAAVETLVPRQ